MTEIWTHPENRHRRTSRLGRWAAWQMWERTVRRPWTVTLHGDVRMICHPHDTVTSKAMYCGLYDAEEMRFLLAWLRPDETFVDVGANVAPYSLLAAGVVGARAVAFEPADLARRRARDNVALNDLAGRVVLEDLAVSDREGSALLTTERWAMNQLVDRAGDDPVAEVATTTLDAYATRADLQQVSLIKIDVEGHEAAVLRGAANLIARDRPALVVEVNEPVAELEAAVASIGYVPVRFDVATRRVDPQQLSRVPRTNVLLVPSVDVARDRLQATVAS